MKIEVNLTKKRFFAFILGLVFLAGAITVYAFKTTYDGTVSDAKSFGHSADETVIKLASGAEMTLQDAYESGLIVTNLKKEGFCNSANSLNGGADYAWTGYTAVSMVIGDRNICEDDNGCTYKVLVQNVTHPVGFNFYGSNAVAFKQDESSNWIEGYENNHGINGDGVVQKITGDSWATTHNFRMSDDAPAAEAAIENSQSQNYSVFVDNSNTKGFTVWICDF